MTGDPEGEDWKEESTKDERREQKTNGAEGRKVPSDAEWLNSLSPREIRWLEKHVKSVERLDKAEIKCTSCNKQLTLKVEGLVTRHPILGVVMCMDCRSFYYSDKWTRDEDGYFEHCRWCGNGGDLLCCSNDRCKSVFCKPCIKRNIGKSKIKQIEDNDDWRCLKCDVTQIKYCRLMYYSVYQYRRHVKAKMKKSEENEMAEAGKAERNVFSDDPMTQFYRQADDIGAKLGRELARQRHDHKDRRSKCKTKDNIKSSTNLATARLLEVISITELRLQELRDSIACAMSSGGTKVESAKDVTEVPVPNGDSQGSTQESNTLMQEDSDGDDDNGDLDDNHGSENDGATSSKESKETGTHSKEGPEETQEKKAESNDERIDKNILLPSPSDDDTRDVSKSKDEVAEQNAPPASPPPDGEKEVSKSDDAVAEQSVVKSSVPLDDEEVVPKPAKMVEQDTKSSSSSGDGYQVSKSDVEMVNQNASPSSSPSDDDEEASKSSNKMVEQNVTSSPPTDTEEQVSKSDGGNIELSLPSKSSSDDESMSKSEYEKIKQSILASSSDDEQNEVKEEDMDTITAVPDSEEHDGPDVSASRSVKPTDSTDTDDAVLKKTIKEENLRKVKSSITKSTRSNSEDVKSRESRSKAVDNDSDSDFGGAKSNSRRLSNPKEIKVDAEPRKVVDLEPLTTQEMLERRFLKLMLKVDPANDKKLRSDAAVEILRFLPEVENTLLASGGTLQCSDYPELFESVRMTNKVNFDAEIDRLCDLKSLKRTRIKRSKSYDADSSSEDENDRRMTRRVGGRKKRIKKKGLADISSGEESDQHSGSSDFTEGLADVHSKGDQLMNANERAKTAVLISSSSSEFEYDRIHKDDKKSEAKKKAKKAIMNDTSDEWEGRSRKKAENPDFLRLKLDESDEDEDVKARVKKVKEAKDEDSEFGENGDAKKSKTRRKRKIIMSESDEGSETDEESEAPSEHSQSSGVENKKSKKRKKRKGSTSSPSSDPDSDGEKKKKKKRRRIKRNSSSEDEKASPSKGRKDIRKIISDKKVSQETKSAALQERERRKRMDERQKLYNEQFKVQEGETLKELPLDFNEETKEVLVEVDKRLARKLKPHQAEGIKFMWDAVFESKKEVDDGKIPGGSILAHCMGLGKTLQTIALIHTVLTTFPDKVTTVLVLCPVNTVKNWEEEFNKWLKGDLEIDLYEMSNEKDNETRAYKLDTWMVEGGAMIMGYDMFRNLTNDATKKFRKRQKEVFQKALLDPGPDLVICDEGHVLKNLKSALNKAMNRIKTKRRVILTGTPLQNNLSEYFAMVNFVKPQLLGSMNEFKNRFVNPIQNGQHSDSTDRDVRIMKKRSFILNDLLKGCMQRLDYNVLVPYLQPKHEYVLCICLTDLQKKLYNFYLDNFARAGRIGQDGKLEGGKKGGIFYDVQNLSRVWNHPYILKMAKNRADQKSLLEDDDGDGGSLKDFIDDGSAEGESTTDSESSDSDKNEVELLEDDDLASAKRPTTRNTKDKAELVGGLDEASREALAANKGWWHQFLEDEQCLDHLELGSKMVLLMDILKECELLGDKVLVFSQSLLSLDLIQDFLDRVDKETAETQRDNTESSETISYMGSWKQGRDYFRMDGSTPPETRKKWCNYFNKPYNHQMRLFLISTKAGGLGINLCAANRVIIFDASWNPAHDVQSIFRVYRFGQEKPVYIYRFLAKGTMEEKIYDRQVTKQSLSARVVDEHQIERHFSMNELADLYVFKDEKEETRPVPKVPKDRLLAEMLKKHDSLIWKYHDHDSLLENQVDENLTEEERKAAWEEFENEKKGFVNMANPGMQFQVLSNINPTEIQAQYRRQYPNLTDEQVLQATRAYILQLQSGIHRKPAYDKSHYQQEMARAKGLQMQMYPHMYATARSGSSGYPSGESSSSQAMTGSSTFSQQQEIWDNAMMLQQDRQIHEQLRQVKERERQAQLITQMYQQQQNLQQLRQQQRPQQDDIVLEGSPEYVEIDASPEGPTTVSPVKLPGASRRGRPRLDPDTDDLLTISPGARAMAQMHELAKLSKKQQKES